MFSIFKIFIISQNIVSSTCAPIVLVDKWGYELSTSSTTTTVFEYSDMIPLKYLKTVLSEKDQIIEQKAEIIGQLNNQLNIFRKILRILGVRSRAETLADDLYPGRKPFHISIAKAFEEILTSTRPEFLKRSCIQVFRQRIASYGISTADFVDGIRSIYGSFSDKAAHKMSGFEPSPPKYNDTTGIEEMLEEFGITADEIKVKTVQIILEPLPLLTCTPAL